MMKGLLKAGGDPLGQVADHARPGGDQQVGGRADLVRGLVAVDDARIEQVPRLAAHGEGFDRQTRLRSGSITWAWMIASMAWS